MRLIKSEGVEACYSNNITIKHFKVIFSTIADARFRDTDKHIINLGLYLSNITIDNIKNFSHVNVGDYNIFTICNDSTFVSTRISTEHFFKYSYEGKNEFSDIESINFTEINFLRDKNLFFLHFYELLMDSITITNVYKGSDQIKEIGTRIGEGLLDIEEALKKYRIVADEEARTLLLTFNYDTKPTILQMVFK